MNCEFADLFVGGVHTGLMALQYGAVTFGCLGKASHLRRMAVDSLTRDGHAPCCSLLWDVGRVWRHNVRKRESRSIGFTRLNIRDEPCYGADRTPKAL